MEQHMREDMGASVERARVEDMGVKGAQQGACEMAQGSGGTEIPGDTTGLSSAHGKSQHPKNFKHMAS